MKAIRELLGHKLTVAPEIVCWIDLALRGEKIEASLSVIENILIKERSRIKEIFHLKNELSKSKCKSLTKALDDGNLDELKAFEKNTKIAIAYKKYKPMNKNLIKRDFRYVLKSESDFKNLQKLLKLI